MDLSNFIEAIDIVMWFWFANRIDRDDRIEFVIFCDLAGQAYFNDSRCEYEVGIESAILLIYVWF